MNRQVVNIADMRVSTDPDDVLITYALGSCIGIAIYDPVVRVGGLLHVMLPNSSIDASKAALNPYMFMDSGVPELFLQSYEAGAVKERLIVKAAGGACSTGRGQDDFFQIGKRNFIMLRKLLWKNSLLLQSYDIGGNLSRTMSLDIRDGTVTLRFNGTTKVI